MQARGLILYLLVPIKLRDYAKGIMKACRITIEVKSRIFRYLAMVMSTGDVSHCLCQDCYSHVHSIIERDRQVLLVAELLSSW